MSFYGSEELALILGISRLNSLSWFGRSYLDATAELVLQCKGLSGLALQLECVTLLPNGVFEWGTPGETPEGVSVARISANGQDWGELRLRFPLEQTAVASPVKLARFLAQQIALAIARAELASANRAHAKNLSELKEEVATRKILERAKGLLAETQNLAPARAEALLKRQSERTGKSLREVSEAVNALQASGFTIPLQRIA